jgi:hypothetical protein
MRLLIEAILGFTPQIFNATLLIVAFLLGWAMMGTGCGPVSGYHR